MSFNAIAGSCFLCRGVCCCTDTQTCSLWSGLSSAEDPVVEQTQTRSLWSAHLVKFAYQTMTSLNAAFAPCLQSLAASPSADVLTTNNGTVVLSLAPPLQVDSDGTIRLVPSSVTEVGDLSSGSIGRGFGECFMCNQTYTHGWHVLQ